ncbi:MAG: hypothetical protein NTY38_16850 [Acidobacteria bacterium]|nr:hypothetical protein [Acidobacteriota bacterium]
MNGSSEGAVPVTDYYVWQVPGKPMVVHLRFDVVDRLLLEVMRGFGAVPRRGAEIGGVLLGHVGEGDANTVYIDDFEVVQCEYRHGPSYLLSETDLARFDEVLERWKPENNHALYPIGYYRSTTKDGLGLNEEDLALFNSRFPAASDVILQVKPYATRVSVGGFFFRESDSIRTESSYLEFPFRRKDLGGGMGGRPSRRNRGEEPSAEPEAPPVEQNVPSMSTSPLSGMRSAPPDFAPAEDEERVAAAAVRPAKNPSRKGNVWIPLSFIFLLLGVLLGFQAAITTRPQASLAMNPYSLGLRLTRAGENIHIRWDRSSPAIRTARRGVLSITDGPITKTVDLDAATLQNGSVIYRRVSNGLGFRLEAFPSENTSLGESIQATVDRIPPEMPARPDK